MECLTKPELLNLLRAARAARERDWLMILLAYNHGLRASEVVSFTPDAIRNGFITIQRLKGSNRTVQALVKHSDPLLNEQHALIEFVSRVNPGERVFPISRQHFWRLVHRYAKAAGIPYHKSHPHILKHSIALHTIKIAEIHNLKQYLGHKSLSSTGEYLKVSDADASTAVQTALRHN